MKVLPRRCFKNYSSVYTHTIVAVFGSLIRNNIKMSVFVAENNLIVDVCIALLAIMID